MVYNNPSGRIAIRCKTSPPCRKWGQCLTWTFQCDNYTKIKNISCLGLDAWASAVCIFRCLLWNYYYMGAQHSASFTLRCIYLASKFLRIKRKSEVGALEFWITRLSQD